MPEFCIVGTVSFVPRPNIVYEPFLIIIVIEEKFIFKVRDIAFTAISLP
jgi:hypothetical protein